MSECGTTVKKATVKEAGILRIMSSESGMVNRRLDRRIEQSRDPHVQQVAAVGRDCPRDLRQPEVFWTALWHSSAFLVFSVSNYRAPQILSVPHEMTVSIEIHVAKTRTGIERGATYS